MKVTPTSGPLISFRTLLIASSRWAIVSNLSAPSGQRRIRAPLCCLDSAINLSKEVLSSPCEGGWGRTQPTGSGVEEVDHGKRGMAGEKKGGLVRTRRTVARKSVRRGPGEEVGLLG